MTANKVRGEIELMLDGTPFVLRPSYQAIEAFQSDTGRGLLDLARRADAGDLTTSEIAAVATRCIQAEGRERKDQNLIGVNSRKVGELIVSAPGGIVLALRQLAVLLFNASTGGYTPSGEVKAAVATETPSAA
jgi:hypothetical protein